LTSQWSCPGGRLGDRGTNLGNAAIKIGDGMGCHLDPRVEARGLRFEPGRGCAALGVGDARLFAVTDCRQCGVTLDRDAGVEIVDILIFGYCYRDCPASVTVAFGA